MDRQEVRSTWQNIQRHIQQYKDDPVAAHEHNPYGKVVPALRQIPIVVLDPRG